MLLSNPFWQSFTRTLIQEIFMRIVIMGTGPFAVPTAQMLLDDGHDIPLVVTRPTANPQAKKQPSRPVFDWAVVNGIEVFEPQSINEPAAIERLMHWGRISSLSATTGRFFRMIVSLQRSLAESIFTDRSCLDTAARLLSNGLCCGATLSPVSP